MDKKIIDQFPAPLTNAIHDLIVAMREEHHAFHVAEAYQKLKKAEFDMVNWQPQD